MAGAALAGTGAAWLIGAPADAADLPPQRATAESGERSPASEERFQLLGLDPAGLIHHSERELLAPVGEALHEVAVAPVRRVAESTLSETGQRAESLTDSVAEAGAQVLDRPQWRGERPEPGPVDRTPPQPQPVTVESAQVRGPQVRAKTENIAEFAQTAPETPESRGNPEPPKPPAVSATAPATTGCGNAADGNPHNAAGIGWHSADSQCTDGSARVPFLRAVPVPVGSPGPQPGITPD
ncbi:hypothetical protein GCM10010470_66790 [Saccharopolyspora taberi]|uniref:Uncharacterized protein n=1 Tax=Saccharopolyspora taberi TaxID=60895 RepID=A0ABN3VNB7_9PSEU